MKNEHGAGAYGGCHGGGMMHHGMHTGCCGEPGHGGGMHHGMHGGCCCGSSHGERRFYTRKETAEHLKKYLEYLKAEAAGVQEEIDRLAAD